MKPKKQLSVFEQIQDARTKLMILDNKLTHESVQRSLAAMAGAINDLFARAGEIPAFVVTRVSTKKHNLSWGDGQGFPIKPAMGDFMLALGRDGEANGNRDKVPELAKRLAKHVPALADAITSDTKRARRKMLLWRAPLLRGKVSEA